MIPTSIEMKRIGGSGFLVISTFSFQSLYDFKGVKKYLCNIPLELISISTQNMLKKTEFFESSTSPRLYREVN